MGTTQTSSEIAPFEIGQEVTIRDIRRIVAPDNTPDLVEEARLRIARDHVATLLKGNMPVEEIRDQQEALRGLGAEAVLGYLPEK